MNARAAARFLALALAVRAAPARAADEAAPHVQLSGRAFEDLYLPTKDHTGPTLEQENTSLWLQGDGRLSPALAGRATYQGDLFGNARLTGERPGAHLRNRLREGYADYFAAGFELRAGKQLIAWGKSDGINPTDFLSAHESNFLNHDAEVTRVAGVALLASLTPSGGASPWSFTYVVQPWFPESAYLVPPAALPAGVSLSETREPDHSARNTELAGKVAYAGQGWDASLSWFDGFAHRPVFFEVSHAVVTPTLVRVNAGREFQRLHAVGTDASLASGPWVYRFESAYLFTAADGNPLLTPSHWDAVLGLERPIQEKFRVQAQYISRYFPHWTDPAAAPGPDPVATLINREIAGANALLQQYQHKWSSAVTLRVSYAAEDPSLTAELLGYAGLNDDDYYLRPLVSYGLVEWLRIYLGLDHYGGPADKSIGSLQTYNAVFTELKATF